ncbi:hypothetical protein RJ640_024993 [Escallonia rubra]|uniref:Uncharacterized protein n=1 Tax=Escallonia rubra TaxID=112253 RepID=A0AA88R8E5_9ASTE|nr:hypothetical protein RJ640_024993 [Escallonia rubra]
MAKARMKWNSTFGLIGTSENLTPLNSAPMYSRKRSELAWAACIDGYVVVLKNATWFNIVKLPMFKLMQISYKETCLYKDSNSHRSNNITFQIVIHKLRNSSSLIISVKLEVYVVYEMTITPPKGHVMALNLIIVIGGYGSKRNDSIIFQGCYKLSNALCKGIRIGIEVLVIDVNAIQVILLNDISERRNCIRNP